MAKPSTKPRTEAQKKKSAEKGVETKRANKAKKAGTTNTGPIFYFSNKTVKANCEKEEKAIKKACDEEKGASQEKAKKAKSSNAKLGELTAKIESGLDKTQEAVKKGYGYNRTDTNGWIEDHCHGLWLKPMGKSDQFDKFQDQLKEVEKGLQTEMDSILATVGGKARDMAKDRAIAYGEKALIREGAALTSLVIPVVGEVIVAGATIWNVVDGVWTAGKVAIDAIGLGKQALEQYKKLAPQLENIQKLIDGKMTPASILADMMTVMATANPCIMARRCSLVPFEKTEGNSKLKSSSGQEQAKTGQGCCPGQTGHHVMPGAMFDTGNNPCGKPYDHSKAPVICLEGANNTVGSHGVAHSGLDVSMNDYKTNNPGKQISYKDASAQAINAVRLTNPLCSKDCLQAQLDKFYKAGMKCRNDAQLKPNAGVADKTKKPAIDATPSTNPAPIVID
jgi:GHH signature containing HNH/Endo VII superfamily nuclease toxin  2